MPANYSFRFEFIDNLRSVTAGINRQFASLRGAAKSFVNEINSNRGIVGLNKIKHAAEGVFTPDRVRGFASSFVEMSDSLALSERLIVGITGNMGSLKESRAIAADLSKTSGMSLIDATKGLAKMLPLAKGNLTVAANLTKSASALAALDPTQGFEGALFALKELESGDALSLRERFGIRVPTQLEAQKIAKRDGKTVQQVMFDSMNSYLDTTYGSGQKGAGIKFLMSADANTIGGQMKRIQASIVSAMAPIIISIGPKVTSFFATLSGWLSNNQKLIANIVPPILAVGLALTGLVATTSAISAVTTSISLLTAGIGALTGIMTPLVLTVGGVALGVAALAAGAIYLWNTFSGFRGFLVGFINSVKEVGIIIFERLVAPFTSLGKIVAGIFTGDLELIKSGFKDQLRAFDFKSDMERIGKASREGYQKGVDAKPINIFGSKKKDESAAGKENIYKALGAKAAAANNTPGTNTGTSRTAADGSISGGGNGSGKNVYINIAKLVETINIHTGGLQDSASRIKEEVARALISAVNDYNYAN